MWRSENNLGESVLSSTLWVLTQGIKCLFLLSPVRLLSCSRELCVVIRGPGFLYGVQQSDLLKISLETDLSPDCLRVLRSKYRLRQGAMVSPASKPQVSKGTYLARLVFSDPAEDLFLVILTWGLDGVLDCTFSDTMADSDLSQTLRPCHQAGG